MKLVEKYRPKNWDEIKGQENVVSKLKNLVANKDRFGLPDLMFIGPPGTGKTSMAHIFAKALGYPIEEFNASDDRKIENVRGRIKRLARIRGNRIIYLGEADNMTTDAQQALRRIMEKAEGTIFILSGNREWKFIDPIKSRCAIFRFKRFSDKSVLRRLLEVCKAEDIKVTHECKEGFLEIVRDARGDMRRALNSLQTLIDENKKITVENVISFRKPKAIKDSFETVIQGDFERAKEILEDAYINNGFNSEKIIEELYRAIGEMKDMPHVKIRLYSELAKVEDRCRRGNSPIVQLVGFLSFAWVAPRLPNGCKVLKGEK